MSQRMSEQQIVDKIEFYIRDVDGHDLLHIAKIVAEAQCEAGDEEWVECLDKLGYGYVVNDIAIYSG